MTNAPTSPDMTKHQMAMTLYDYAKTKGVASGDVAPIINRYVHKPLVPSYLAAKAAIDQLKPHKPEIPQPDTARDLRLAARGIPVTPQNRTLPKSDGKTAPVCNPHPPKVGRGLSERQQLEFDRQCMYARYGRLTAGQVARLRVVEQRLRVM